MQEGPLQALRHTVAAYASAHGNRAGLALTPVPGLRMMCAPAPSGPMHSLYRPLLCVVLQGAKHLSVAGEDRLVQAGDTVVVTVDAPVTGRIVRASPQQPYLAVAVEFDLAVLQELALALDAAPAPRPAQPPALLVAQGDDAVLDCAARLVGLLQRPEAVPLLQPGISRELHYWLLCGRHAGAMRALALPDSHSARLVGAMRMLRASYAGAITVEQLAAAAGMSESAFHRHFKALTSLTPIQFQKQLRLVEARRLMLDEGLAASRAAFAVGYESVPHFTRDYARLFGAPPRQDVRRIAARVTAGPQAAHAA